MSGSKAIAHFASISIDCISGMGRVAFHWRESFFRRGWTFRHYGVDEVPPPPLKPLWAVSAKRAWMKAGERHDLLLAHEPIAGTFWQPDLWPVLFSHGLEERCQELSPREPGLSRSWLRDRVMSPFWLWQAKQRELGLKRCPLLLLSSQEDRDYAISHYGRRPEDIFVFRNGVYSSPLHPQQIAPGPPTVLFYGTWMERKGKTVLVRAASKLASEGYKIRYLIAGGKTEAEVLMDWPVHLRGAVEVKPNVTAKEEDSIYERATVYVLPSYFEGQPLALLQAMESGFCVITTRCCGQKDIVKHGHNGFLFEPGNSDQLARMIAAAIDNRDMRLKMGEQAKSDMASRSWPVVADEVVQRLEKFAQMNICKIGAEARGGGDGAY